ncbi:hypothetical protein [Oscillibacter sp.]|jgi:phage-related minor tail protein|uniref:hypothetical protein n=1 Tax=Oscillibacter sp. TaxID=1945593 RepID=UPI00216F1E26|nr:hypothetical protein [Oscillibacter sp.]MCI9241018.1 hypothetical protein [Oscillibacter sp.]
MANDGTVKIGAEIDEKEFKSGLSKVSKAAQSAFNNLSGSFSSISRNAETGFSAVNKGLEKTKTTISTTEKKLKELEKALKLDPQNVELLDQKQRLLAQSAEATAEKYERLKEVVESSTVSNVAFAKWEKAQAPLQEQISKTTGELENLERKAKELEGLGFSPDSSSMIEVQRRAEAAQEKLVDLQKSLSDTYDEMGRPISIEQWDDLQRELSEAKHAADEAQDAFDNFDPVFSRFGSMADDISGKAGKVADATKGISLAAGGVLTAMLGSAAGTEEFRSDLSKLDTNAQLAGVGLDSARDAMRQLNTVSDETDSSVEALSNLLQAGVSESTLQQAVENLAGAAVSFPDTIKIESLADSLQETLATGEATGQFAEVLNRLGINTDEFNNQLSQVPGTADKLHFALDTLQNEGLAGVYNAWVENNEALVKNKDASFEFKESLAELGEEMQPLMTTVTELAGSFLDWFNDLSDGQQGAIVALIGIVAAISPVASAISSVSGAVGAVTKNLGAVKNAASSVFSLFTSNPMLLAIGAISAALLLLILNWDKVKETVENVIDAVIGFIEKGIDAVKRFFSALSNGKDKTGGPSKSPSPVSPRSPRPRARMAAFADNETDGNNGEGASITAGTFSRAATVRALESAIPNVESRVAMATAAMAPAAGYSAPPMAHSGGGADHRQPVQQPIHQTITINFTGDLAQLGRVLKPIIDTENQRIGPGV